MRLKNLIFLLVLAVVLIVIPGTYSVYADQVGTGWEDLEESNDLNTGRKYQDIYDDAVNGRWSFQTINTSSVLEFGQRYFNHIILPINSRITLDRKLRVHKGQELSIVATGEDYTSVDVTTGGYSLNGGASQLGSAGMALYWCPIEYNNGGNILVNSSYRDVTNSWRVGYSDHGVTDFEAPERVAMQDGDACWIVPILRVNSSNASDGADMDAYLNPTLLSKYQHFAIVSKPFTYTFKLNGGSYGDVTSDITWQRLGVTDVRKYGISVGSPYRAGYEFRGWKVLSAGKEYGAIISNADLNTMMTDGKYYDSLFRDAVFEAQWKPAVTLTHDDRITDVSGAGRYNPGDYVELNAVPSPGSSFSKWSYVSADEYIPCTLNSRDYYLAYDDSYGRYVVRNRGNNAINYGYTGLAESVDGGWWFVRDGHIDFTYTGLAGNERVKGSSEITWWFVHNGQIEFGYNEYAVNSYGLFKCKNGYVDFNASDVGVDSKITFYMPSYNISLNAEGDYGKNTLTLTKDTDIKSVSGAGTYKPGTWVSISAQEADGGKFNGWSLIGADGGISGSNSSDYKAVYENGRWVAKINGNADYGYTGMASNDYGWWYFVNGSIDLNYTGLAFKETDWWYYSNGSVDFNYNGIAVNAYGAFYVRGGAVVRNADGSYAVASLKDKNMSFQMPSYNVTLKADGEIPAPEEYAISYNLDGGSLPAGKSNPKTYNSQTGTFTLNNPVRNGYEFTGWTGTGLNTQAQTVTVKKGSTGNRSYTAHWKKKASTTAAYTIKHYLQNADGTYSYRESTTGNAAIGNTIADMRKKYDGYTQPAVKSVKISSKASDNVIEYRYPRKTYKINISGDKGISAVRHYSITDSKTKDSYRWGESVRINADVKEGYTWSKWTGVSNVKNKKYDFTMPQSDVNRKATTTAISYSYTVKYYWQNADGTYTEKKDLTVTGKAGFGTKVSAPLLKYEKETDADKFNPSVNKMTDSRYYPTTNKKDKITQAATITIGTKPENNVITYYYNRKTYPMKLSYKTGISGVTHYSYTDKSSKNEYRWGESVKIEAAVKDGYSFSRWTSNEAGNADKYTNPYEFIMPVIYVDRIANAVKKTADVTIEHYVMDTDGKYPAAPKKTQTVKYEYFTLLKSEQLKDNSLIKAGAIEYDPDSTKRETLVTGSTVIKLYYKRIKHNVTFNAAYNGGRHASGDSKDITVQFYYGADIPLDSYRAMKLNNYKFKGWNTSPDAKDVLGRQKMGTSDITYYAVYYKQITVTFTDSEGTTTRTAELYNNEAGADIEVPEIADYTGWADNTVTTYDIEDINEEKAESINKTGENERTDGENISPGNMQDKSAAVMPDTAAVMPDTAGKEEETTVAQTPADSKTKESTGSDKAVSTAESGNSKASDSTDSTTDSKNDSTTKTSSSAGNGKTSRMVQDITGNTDKTIQPYEIQETPDNNKAEQTHTPAGTDKLVSEYKSTGYTSIKDINKDGATDAQITTDTKIITVSESRDYYALYSAGVTLSYVLNGGTENETTVPVEDTAYCNASALDTIKGKKLKLARCEKPEYDENGYIHSYSFVVWAENSEEGSRFAQESEYELKQNTVMYAMWDEQLSPVEYDIVFDGNKGAAVKHVPSPVHAVYDEEVTLPDTKPERLGFTFLNWNTRADGEGTTYNPSDKVKNLTTVNGSEVKLYAQWKKRKIHVVKAASTSYNADIIKRTPGDDEWYNTTGRLSIDGLKDYADDESIQVWKIDNQGNITRTK